jgi:putative hydrolase of the HAD superfamily
MPGAASLRFDAVLFDLGSTLFYYQGDWLASRAESNERLLDALLAAGLNLERTAFLAEWESRLNTYQNDRDEDLIEHSTGVVLRNVLASLGHTSISDQVLRQALAKMYAVTQRHWKAEPDAVPTLEALRSRGYRLGILSNAADDDDVRRLVDQAEVGSYLDFVLTSSSLGVRKPHLRTFHAALTRWGMPPDRVAMVGDNLRADILGAKSLGIFSIWITRRIAVEGPVDTGEPVIPDATIQTLSELLPLLERLNQNSVQ